MSELNKRKDLIQTIQITETKTEKVGKKKDKEALVGYVNIIAKRPGGASIIAPSKNIQKYSEFKKIEWIRKIGQGSKIES